MTFTSSKARTAQTPSWSIKFWTCSSVITSPRDGSNGTPPRVQDDFLGFPGGAASPRRAKAEITCPAVPPSRCASSLAAWSTSSSMSKVVLMHLMLSHHRINVKSAFIRGSINTQTTVSERRPAGPRLCRASARRGGRIPRTNRGRGRGGELSIYRSRRCAGRRQIRGRAAIPGR